MGERTMTVIQQLNGLGLYLIAGGIILFIACFCAFFALRAWRAGLAMGMDKTKMKRVIASSATFTILPSVGILLGVIALSGSLGTPLPWLRLSVIGALHYETTVADVAARAVGMSGLVASEMTFKAFCTIALLMTVGIIWGPIINTCFTKTYLNRLSNPKPKKEKKGPSPLAGFADIAMTAMFIGLISAYIGSYMGSLVNYGQYTQMLTVLFSAAAMAIFLYLAEKKQMAWVENFAVAGSMLVGMTAAVLAGLWL